jgi:repressor LexA
MESLTPRQEEVFDFILDALEKRGYPPSIREICEEFDLSSTRGALRHLEALVGEVPAGPLRYASEEVEEWVPVPARLGGGGRFLLRIKGDSMIGDGINDGDLVVVDPDSAIDKGEVVVALVDGEATVKRLRRRKGAIELEASNPAYGTIRVGEGEAEVRLAGKVVALLREKV